MLKHFIYFIIAISLWAQVFNFKSSVFDKILAGLGIIGLTAVYWHIVIF